MSYPNQKHITVHLAEANRNNLYSIRNISAEQQAMKNLNPLTFYLWCYLSQNQNGYSFDLSFVAANNAIGIKKTAYYEAKKELVAKGYLVKDKASGNGMIFKQIPDAVEADPIEPEDIRAETAPVTNSYVSLGKQEPENKKQKYRLDGTPILDNEVGNSCNFSIYVA